MMPIRGLTVSVGYAETLTICLPRNMSHLSECWVITSPDDHATQEVARSVPGARLSITDDFTKYGARFNKGLAIERSGFNVMGRDGWILVHDADVLFPDSMPLGNLDPTRLYGCRRRILEDPGKWRPDLDWQTCPMRPDGDSPIGFFQLFAAEDPALKDKPYWYDPSFAHAGGGDAFFITHWPRSQWTILPFEVLHLGPVDRNWFGCDPAGRDMMAAFVTRCGWRGAMRGLDPAAARRAGPFVERVEVPGYPRSEFELPFIRRAQRNLGRPAR